MLEISCYADCKKCLRTIKFARQGSIFWQTFPLIRQGGPPTLRQGLADTSKEALKARRCCVVKMVRGRFERLCSLPSSPPFPPPEPPPPSSSSLFTEQHKQIIKQSEKPVGEGTFSFSLHSLNEKEVLNIQVTVNQSLSVSWSLAQ